MYDTQENMPKGERCREPDWEAEIEKSQKGLDVIKRFKKSLIEFIGVIGQHSFRSRNRESGGSIPELLGIVELDIMQREKQVARLMENMEK